jgi:hypothetical protein
MSEEEMKWMFAQGDRVVYPEVVRKPEPR